MKLITQIALVLCTLLVPFTAQAEFKQPWETGEDIGKFYQQWCTSKNLESTFFPAFSAEDQTKVKHLMFEVMWTDFSDFLLSAQQSETKNVVSRLSSDNQKIDAKLTAMANDALSDNTRYQLIAAHNENSEQREFVMESYKKFAMSDPQGVLAGALFTYSNCLIIRNVKSIDPLIALRIAEIKKTPIPKPQIVVEPKKKYSGGCSCADGNVCFGERGGRFCLTSGGKRRYGI